MAKSQETFNKKQKEKKRLKKRKEKAEKMAERRANAVAGSGSLENMMAYIDENGNIVDTPPDPTKKKKVSVANIELGAAKREKITVDPFKTGKVDFFDHSKGFGFIRDIVTQEKFFVHINGCQEEITEGDNVKFEIERGMKGMNAVRVKKA